MVDLCVVKSSCFLGDNQKFFCNFGDYIWGSTIKLKPIPFLTSFVIDTCIDTIPV